MLEQFKLTFVRHLPLIFILLNLSCFNRIVQIAILSDRKEIASAIAIYNKENPRFRFILHYARNIDFQTIVRKKPDLVISANLISDKIQKLMRPLENPYHTYEVLKSSGSGNRSYFIPLSFELPLLVGLKEQFETLPDSMVIKIRHLSQITAPFTSSVNPAKPERLGFSFTWNPAIYIDMIFIEDPAIFTSDELNHEAFAKISAKIRRINLELTGGAEAIQSFERQNSRIPDISLVLKEKIMLARISFSEWIALPYELSKKLRMRYLSDSRHIPVTLIRSAAIPLRAKSSRKSLHFIEWLMQKETQSALMERWEKAGINVFGFLGGLSSIPEVNNTIIVARFPEMEPMIPENHYLRAPDKIIDPWHRVRDEILIPWLDARIKNPNHPVSLMKAFQDWDNASIIDNASSHSTR